MQAKIEKAIQNLPREPVHLLEQNTEESLDTEDVLETVEALISKSRTPQITRENTIWNDAVGAYLNEAAFYYPHFTQYQTEILYKLTEEEDAEKSMQLVQNFKCSVKPEQEKKVSSLVRETQGDPKKMIVQGNLLLVAKEAKKFTGMIPFDEAIEVGNEALVKAAKGFKRTKGFEFSTYATICIRDRILEAADVSPHSIYIPPFILRGARRASSIAKDHYYRTGKKITDEELFLALKSQYSENTKESRLHRMVKTYRGKVKYVDYLYEERQRENGESVQIIDVFPDRSARDPQEIVVEKEERQERIIGAVKMMYEMGATKDEIRLILYRCGIVTGYPMTLDEVGKALGIARSTLQKRESNLLRKLGLTQEEIGLNLKSKPRERNK